MVRSHLRRASLSAVRVAVLLVLLPVLVVLVDPRPALAFSPGFPPVSLPGSLAAAAAVAEGEGAVAGVELAGAAVVAAPVVVAAAPVALVAASALAVAGAVAVLWKWGSGHKASYADPAPAGAGSYAPGWSGFSVGPGPDFLASVNGPTGTASEGVMQWKDAPAYAGQPDSGRYLRGGTSPGSPWTRSTRSNFGTGAVAAVMVYRGTIVAKYGAEADSIVSYYATFDGRTTPDSTQPAPPAAAPGATVITTTPTSQCSGGGSVAGSPVTYKGGDASGSLPRLVLPSCPAGSYRVGASFPTTAPGGLTVPSPLAPWTAPTIPSAFPECQPGGVCQLTLLQVSPASQSTLVCNGSPSCAGWSTLPLQAPNRTVQDLTTGQATQVLVPTDPQGKTYRCMWGPYELKASECLAVGTEPPPGTSANPGTESTDNNCDFSAISFNPVSWVVVPLKCLFIPDTASISGDTATLRDAWGKSAPGAVVGAVTGVVRPFTLLPTGGSGCEGPQVSLPIPFAGPMVSNPFSTCNELAQLVLSVMLPIETFLVGAAALVGGARILSRTIGAESL